MWNILISNKMKPWIHLVTFIVGIVLFVLITIWWPTPPSCRGWCCRLSPAVTKIDQIEFRPTGKMMQSFCADLPCQPRSVNVIENFCAGFMSLNITHQPLFELAKLAMQLTPETKEADKPVYQHKGNLLFVGISGRNASPTEILFASYMAHALLATNGHLVISGVKENALPIVGALQTLSERQMFHWQKTDVYEHKGQTWTVAKMMRHQPDKSVSEYIYEICCEYLQISPTKNAIKYYSTSLEREKEVRKAYRQDTVFGVCNVTSGIHAFVLKVMFPSIKIILEAPTARHPQEEELFPKMVDFLVQCGMVIK